MEMLLVYLILLGNISNRMEFDRMAIVYEAMVRRISVEYHSLSKEGTSIWLFGNIYIFRTIGSF